MTSSTSRLDLLRRGRRRRARIDHPPTSTRARRRRPRRLPASYAGNMGRRSSVVRAARNSDERTARTADGGASEAAAGGAAHPRGVRGAALEEAAAGGARVLDGHWEQRVSLTSSPALVRGVAAARPRRRRVSLDKKSSSSSRWRRADISSSKLSNLSKPTAGGGAAPRPGAAPIAPTAAAHATTAHATAVVTRSRPTRAPARSRIGCSADALPKRGRRAIAPSSAFTVASDASPPLAPMSASQGRRHRHRLADAEQHERGEQVGVAERHAAAEVRTRPDEHEAARLQHQPADDEEPRAEPLARGERARQRARERGARARQREEGADARARPTRGRARRRGRRARARGARSPPSAHAPSSAHTRALRSKPGGGGSSTPPSPPPS